MKKFLGVALLMVPAMAPIGASRADEKAAMAVLDKAIAAMGGEEALAKAKVLSWKSKGTITIMGDENPISTTAVVEGLTRYRGEFMGEFNGNEIKGVTVLDGDKAWRKFGDNLMEIEGDGLEREKRTVYLQVVAVLPGVLKEKGFKVDTTDDQKVGDKPAAALKVTGPEGKTFTLAFDKETGLPVKMVAQVPGFGGDEYTQETTFSDYKDFGGIKKATKIESKRDGEKFLETTTTDFKTMDKAPADAFAKPE